MRPGGGVGGRVLVVIAVGGVIGAELRYGTGRLFPSGPSQFPWATVAVNVIGGFGIGVLMGVLARTAHPHPLIRPFLGVGVLGGFTTFSTYSTDTYRLIDAGRPEPALGYAALTLVAALLATVVGLTVGRAVPGPAGHVGPAGGAGSSDGPAGGAGSSDGSAGGAGSSGGTAGAAGPSDGTAGGAGSSDGPAGAAAAGGSQPGPVVD